MAIFTANNTAELLKYVSSAANGDTIHLGTGSYSGVLIQNVAKSGNVTITSADPTHPALLNDLTLRNCQGLTFSNLEMLATKDMPFQVLSSSRITIDQVDVHGVLDGSSATDVRGMLVRDSDTVTVSNSHFHELTDALSHIDSQNVTFADNRFDLIRDNGIAGGGTSHLAITGNVFSDFDHVGPIHPDAIQIWTTNTSTMTTDIVVSNNVFNRGNGVAVQGIFITDQTGISYDSVTVTGNVIVGGSYNGIMVQGAKTANVSGNVVIAEEDQASWIGVRNVANATMNDNIATSINNVSSNVVRSGNVQATALTLADAANLSVSAAASFESAVLSTVSLLGFSDTPSATKSYVFTMLQLDGTAGADRLQVGSVGSYHLYGYDGNDSLGGGRSGASILEGGKGNDNYTIYQASDTIVERPGEGNDTVYTYASYTLAADVESIRGMAAGLTLHGNALDNGIIGGNGGSTLTGEDGNDSVQGGSGNDVMSGDAGNDRLYGFDGDDRIDGGQGKDVLSGGNGNDWMQGGAGNDSLEGGAGADVLTGGKGADTVVFRGGDFGSDVTAAMDTITDFTAADGDRISLSSIDANRLTANDNAFKFIGAQGFHGIAGELRFAADGDGITVYGDTNGDKIPDLAIHLSGIQTVAASSFFL